MNDSNDWSGDDREDIHDVEVALRVKVCGECGILFGVMDVVWDIARRDRRDVFCSNGHPLAAGVDIAEELNRTELQALARRAVVAEVGRIQLADQVDAYRRDGMRSARVPMLFRRSADPKAPGCVRPCWPFDEQGRAIEADGELHLTTAQAAAIGGGDVASLRERFRTSFPQLFEPTEADGGEEGHHGI